MIAYILILAGLFARLMPHVPNMAPIAAIALFSGAYLDRRIVPWVPLVIMVLSDMIIGIHDVVPYTWGAFILIGYMGTFLKRRRTPGSIFAGTILSVLLFFVISNFGVWLAWYPHTAEGMVSCYMKALPFLRNTLAANMAGALVLFGVYETAERVVKGATLRKVLLAAG